MTLKLKPEYAYKLLTGSSKNKQRHTHTLAMHFKCSEEDIINQVGTNAKKITSPNYLVKIKKVLGLPPNVEIAEVKNDN
jgi:hypothetical protein